MANDSNNLLRNLLLVAGIIFLLVLSLAAYKASNTYSTANAGTIRVSADAKISAAPDVAKFNFSVITEGGTEVGELQEENTEKMNSAIAYLKEQGIEEDNIQTSSYNVSPRYSNQFCRTEDCPAPEIVGYTVSQRVDVESEDFDGLGEILEGVITRGANNVSSLQFTIDDPFDLEVEAKAEAINRAKGKAQDLADEVGFKLGRVVGIEEGGNGVMPYARSFETFAMEDDGANQALAPDLQPGSQEVNVTVTLEYEVLN